MINFLFVLHFICIFLIIVLVILQKSAESSVLVSSSHFSVSTTNKLLVKITKILVCFFVCNCLLISYLKYHHTKSNTINNNFISQSEQAEIPPMNNQLPDIDTKNVPID